MSGQWIFGYGSLVSPASFGLTLRRDLTPGADFFEAEIAGFGRRWNYGTAYTFTSIDDDPADAKQWTFIALGLIRAESEVTNGVIAWVDDSEIAALDARERRYDRVDVTGRSSLGAKARSIVGDEQIATYMPRPESVDTYETAKAAGVAAITKRYWDLVDGAFGDLGEDRRERYHALTVPPEIPIIEQPAHEVAERHRSRR